MEVIVHHMILLPVWKGIFKLIIRSLWMIEGMEDLSEEMKDFIVLNLTVTI